MPKHRFRVAACLAVGASLLLAPQAHAAVTTTGSFTASGAHDYLGLGNRLVFSTVDYNPNADQTVTVLNTGKTPLRVTSLRFSGRDAGAFRLAAGQVGAFNIAAGASAPVRVKFAPTRIESNQATLTINTDKAGARTVSLGGMNSFYFEDVHEPSVQAIFDSLGYKVRAGVSDERSNFVASGRTAVGDEILTPYFKVADANRPVQMRMLAHYSGRTAAPDGPFGVFVKGNRNNRLGLMSTPGGTNWWGGENQKLLPAMTAGSTVDYRPNPATTFGIWSNWSNSYSDDALNYSKLHAMRVYPAKDSAGRPIANSYLVAVDGAAAGRNADFQDFVFLVSNVVGTK